MGAVSLMHTAEFQTCVLSYNVYTKILRDASQSALQEGLEHTFQGHLHDGKFTPHLSVGNSWKTENKCKAARTEFSSSWYVN